MSAGVFDLFKLGVGPSSSHTMGPMTAAARFLARLEAAGALAATARVETTLYASLAMTGRGHATDRAVILGLAGFEPATIDPDAAEAQLAQVSESGRLTLGAGGPEIGFSAAEDILWQGRTRLPQHPNALRFRALDGAGETLAEGLYFSIGGGFVVDEAQFDAPPAPSGPPIPFDFASADELLEMAQREGVSIAQLMWRNEIARRSPEEVNAGLDAIFEAMEACIERGLRQDGCLPGGLKVRRRARQHFNELTRRMERNISDPLAALDWVNLWALSVNEENASGGKVVTAPTNGAAGLLPAVLRFYDRFYRGGAEGRRTFLLTAAAIGALYKRNASISGAEVGCQGEVGVACSMAAAGLTAALGGTNAQIENAAEIAMEHNLGLTCDPIGGLVQVPCIERNAMGAVKAIDASRLALLGDGQHSVSLDKVIATMKRTGEDMNEIYKETSLGGLAVNVVEC
ncbi:L-serine ammonia-lyase [Phenylobacterium sp.]|uniref:L-serine ammonia-lyase n=1 Tax=Phenylobacterium sp. TaxID=1871053 RepID=UPI00273078C3|nr:L-serine ammonia-lyase [Phenylobacterium sp.]MDP1874898.1 L-serine ammonia-lyase [Phenylobacterium sp.]MDP3298774.1 L-serine ammonia-lyase [Phenylobacterium sp.]